MKKILFILFCLFGFQCFSQEVPNLTTEQNEIKDLVWNKWDTKNFIILSLDYNQGIYLKNNIEKIKESIFEKWNFRNVEFTTECKVICVKNKGLLNKLFKIEEPRAEVRIDKEGKISLSALWFFLDENNNFPEDKLAEVCFSYLEQDSNKKMSLFLKKGMSALSEDVGEIKDRLLNENILNIDSNSLINVNIEIFEKLSQQDRDKFVNQSSSLILLFRKEYGRDNLNNYIDKNELGSFGIKNTKELNEIINRYNRYLLDDLKEGKVPSDYLKIK
jgi:hypothetical protein